MVGFWMSAGAMVAMVALLMVQAMRHGRREGLPGGAEDLAIYRDQLAEVDRDLTRGVIAEDEAQRLRLEVQRRMLEADRSTAPALPAARSNLTVTAVLVALVLAGAGLLYWTLGAPGYPDLPIAARLANAEADYRNRPSQDAAEAKQPAYAPPADADKATLDLMEKLRAAVKARPDDLKGQLLLAENEAKLGNFAGARKAQAEVIRLKGADATAQDYGTLAELMIFAAGGTVTPEAEAALSETVKRNPRDGAARFYLGLMAAQVGRPDRTFELWKPLLDEGPADAPWMEPIRQRLQDIADAAGIPYEAPQAGGPSASDMANAAQMAPEDRQKMIEGMVGGLESRLMEGGGPVEDWVKLINALGVLKATDRAKAAYAKAQAAFAGRPGELSALKAAAVQAGIAE